jgi:hypothetical protein
MRIGYGRVSTRDQHPEAQHDALTAAGCDEIFIDTAAGKLARRAELEKALLSVNRAGDQLVITKLDRLGRSLEHLIELSKQLQERGVVVQSDHVMRRDLAGTSPSPTARIHLRRGGPSRERRRRRDEALTVIRPTFYNRSHTPR